MHSLMLTFAESVNLGVYDDGMVAHIFAIDSPRPYRVTATIGNRAHLHSTGMGKAIAAHLASSELERVLLRLGLPSRTPNTITSIDALREELARIRESGVSHDNQEDVEGVECFAAPILGTNGAVVASMSISGPSVRMRGQAVALQDAVRETARRISFVLGWIPARSETPAASV